VNWKCLSAIAEAGTVTAAAAAIALTQSAASQALAALEAGLGVALFDRIGRRLLLNEHGRLLLPRARTMLDAAQDMQRLFDDHAAMHLRLGASTTIGNYLLPEQIARFRQASAGAGGVDGGQYGGYCRCRGRFQGGYGFYRRALPSSGLVVEPWQDDTLLVFAAASHPLAQGAVSLAQLAQAQWVLRERGSGTREEVERLLLPHVGSFGEVMEMGHSEAIKRAVAAGWA
jgi:DNA-binding transcriptional LysR family regulator